jgi:copper/silver efflux system protein
MPAQREGLVAQCIRGSLARPWLVLLAALALAVAGVWSVRETTIDALPDLSDVQVIVRTSYAGQAPQVVEDQVTFPLTSALLSVPRATTVRGYSFFGDSFVYVLFADGTDPYWARSRVLEQLGRVEAQLPAGVRPALGPDATGVGWVYEYALVDRTGAHDLAQLRSLQDWWLRYELQSLDGVAEVATIGGMVKEYQVILDPDRLRAYGIPIARVRAAIAGGNGAAGGSVVELAEAEYVVRSGGYVRSPDDLKRIPLDVGERGVAVTVGDVADVRLGPELRRGVADLDGEGEVVGGAVIVRYGANAYDVIQATKARLRELTASLPAGVAIVETYDRSTLIERLTRDLAGKLLLECLVVLLICLAFLRHARSGLVVLAVLPLGILAALGIMRAQGIDANVMSLGGIAIAIGTMVDAAIVMIENVHKRLERAGAGISARERAAVVEAACIEVGPALFVALAIIGVSFLPILVLEAQEGRLFAPLAYTKTYAVLAAAVLSITLVPVLIHWLARGRLRPEAVSPLNRAAASAYRPLLGLALRHPRAVLVVALAAVIVSVLPATRLGTEFMPELDEGDLLYMPVTLPGISIDAARDWLQRSDRALREIPEVQQVFGKAGRADTATDPAPLEMVEAVVRLKPRSEWRAGLTPERLTALLDEHVRFPGVTNAWLPPVKARVEMSATGTRTALGIGVTGPSLAELERLGVQVESIVRGVPGVSAVYAERAGSGRYIDVDVDRAAAARYGLNIDDVHEVVRYAIGGATVGQSIEGRERYPINVRYPQEWRDSVERLRTLPIVTAANVTVALGDVATLRVADGPAQIRSEDALPVAWVLITPAPGELRDVVREARRRLAAELRLPPGYGLRWSGQYQYFERAVGRLYYAVPLVVIAIVALLYLAYRRFADVAIILGALPVAFVGGVWLMWLLGYHSSIGAAVGFIALAGVAAETGIVMLLYLNTAWSARLAATAQPARRDLLDAITEGALLRLRPKLMTVGTIILSLMPIMLSRGAGSEVMKRIAAPIVGGMASATLLTLVIVPALFLLVRGRELEARR